MSDTLTIQSHKGPYTAVFDEGAIARANKTTPEDAHFIIDRQVAELYAADIENILAHRSVLLIEAKEENKSLDRFPGYVEHLVNHGIFRDHVLVAMGGGIIQDITCFLAATMLRGLEWTFYPTTLLAQADSCIGSKSSINAGSAKNILGTFTPPREIFISARFLDTLDEKDVRSGVGEMLKVHAIDGPDSFDRLADGYERLFSDRRKMADAILRSLEIKKRTIEEDEFDTGPRNIFNFGHTFGHAIEAATDFSIPHGIAVTIGMDMANHVAVRLGIGDEAHAARMRPVLKVNFRGFQDHPVPMDRFIEAISKDKKNTGRDTVTLILPDREAVIGKHVCANDEAFAGYCADYLERERAQ